MYMTYSEQQRKLAHDLRQRFEHASIPAKSNPAACATKLRQWWNSMPPRTREHPWSLATIITLAFAEQDRKPAARHVAEALRQMGFTERRDWSRAGRNRRYWMTPALRCEHNPTNFKDIYDDYYA